MTNWRTIVSNSDTLSAADLPHDVTVEIESVVGGEFEATEDDKAGKVDRTALIGLVGKQKKLAANTINCNLIEAICGSPEIEDWPGHLLTIGPDKVEVRGRFFGDPCIRVHGSPELEKDLTVTIALPRRKPFTRKLTKTGSAKRQSTPSPTAPEQYGDIDAAGAFDLYAEGDER